MIRLTPDATKKGELDAALARLAEPESRIADYEPGIYTGPTMTEQAFLAALTGRTDDLQLAVEALRATGQPFCLIDGLAVNHYVEPVVTLDADFAITGAVGLVNALQTRGFQVESFPHSINARLEGSRLRLQITVNSRYGDFPARAVAGRIFDVDMPVASLTDLVQGKLWAMADPRRRASKRAKDRADLIRICESHPQIIPQIPPGLVAEVDDLRQTG